MADWKHLLYFSHQMGKMHLSFVVLMIRKILDNRKELVFFSNHKIRDNCVTIFAAKDIGTTFILFLFKKAQTLTSIRDIVLSLIILGNFVVYFLVLQYYFKEEAGVVFEIWLSHKILAFLFPTFFLNDQ